VTFESVPLEPAAELWSGTLVPRPDIEDAGGRGLFGRRLRPEEITGALPIVGIGRPEVLRALTSFKTPGFEDLVIRDYYLLRLWCSFRGAGVGLEFERAQFTLSLRSSGEDRSTVVARDMYPSEVLYKVKRDVNVALTPEVKFAEVDVKLGEFHYGFTYEELQPQIVAAGQGESTPSWMFSKTKSRKLEGGKALHLLVAAPEGTEHADADLELTAYVTKSGLLPLPMGLFERSGEAPPARLEVPLW
jgi:hypothetical protein